MRKQRFHIEDWIDYYNAELDDDDFRELIFFEDHSKITSGYFDNVTTASISLESDTIITVCATIIDEETGDEREDDVEVDVDFSYSVDYTLDRDRLKKRIRDLNRALNEALDQGAYMFEIRVPFTASEAYDINVSVIDVYSDEADEGEVYSVVSDEIKSRLTNFPPGKRMKESIKPPSNKDVQFTCKIPDEE